MTIAGHLVDRLREINNKLHTPDPVKLNIYAMSKAEREENGIRDLPTTLMDALKELQKDEIIQHALGEHLFKHFLEAKEVEWELFRTTVHPWEREQYLTSF